MAKTVEELASRWLPGTEIGDAESRVLQSAVTRRPLARDINRHVSDHASLGERLADAIARVGGSWTFIVSFLLFLVLWTVGNAWLLSRDAFDPYPFIFLNLVLSMLAAIQAPVIMMSQNRQAARDRLDAAHDYEVNLKAEIEIMALHEKMDALRHNEIVAMHSEVRSVSERLERLEAALRSERPGS
jgi:uncharacterized membrane protein